MAVSRRAVSQLGARVVLRGPTKRCRDVLVRTGLVDLFAVEDADAAPLSGRAVLAGRGS